MTPWLLLSASNFDDPEWVKERETEATADRAKIALAALKTMDAGVS